MKKALKNIQLKFKKLPAYLRYLYLAFVENNGITKIGNLYFVSNFEYNYQLKKNIKRDPTILNLRNLIPKDSIFIDIGANIGKISLIFSSLVDKVYSFEPVISSYSNLLRNIELNKINNVIPLNVALSDKCSFLEITNIPFGETNKVVKTHLLENEICREFDFINVYATTLDYLNNFYFHLNDSKNIIIKIDTESHEQYVLNGAKSLLKTDSQILVCLEFTQRNKDSLIEFMLSLKFKQIDCNNFSGIIKDDENLYFANHNFLKGKNCTN